MELLIQKLYEDSILPQFAHEGDAGMDLYVNRVISQSNTQITYGLGIAVKIPDNHVGLIFPRSSITTKTLMLKNCVGVIDSGYRGEIKFRFQKTNPSIDVLYNIGDKIGQIIILPYPHIDFVEVSELSNTNRGIGGYGSTGN